MLTTVRSTTAESERIEMGGVVDPDRGALLYKKTTKVETVQGSGEIPRKKIKKVTSEMSWLGKPGKKSDQVTLIDEAGEEEQWHDEETEQNPLYSTKDYVTDFDNPLYNRRISGIEGGGGGGEDGRSSRASGASSGKDGGRAARGRPTSQDTGGKAYVDYLSEQPDLREADTLF